MSLVMNKNDDDDSGVYPRLWTKLVTHRRLLWYEL